jgi:hypothetical protein
VSSCNCVWCMILAWKLWANHSWFLSNPDHKSDPAWLTYRPDDHPKTIGYHHLDMSRDFGLVSWNHNNNNPLFGKILAGPKISAGLKNYENLKFENFRCFF